LTVTKVVGVVRDREHLSPGRLSTSQITKTNYIST